MKTLLLAVVLCGLSFGEVRADEPSFIIVTVETLWGALKSSVGEVERVWSVTPDGYVIAGSDRKSYIVPKANARPITAGEAAVALLAQRDSMNAELYAMDAELETKDAKIAALQGKRPTVASEPRPTQYNGRPLPPNWIDPKQADQNFYNQQLLNQQRATQAELQRLQQQLQQRR